MIVQETFDVAAPVEYVYDQMSDVGDIGYCVAGVQSVTVLNERESEWKIEQRFGAMARRFRLHATMTEAERPSRIKFTASGQDVNVTGQVDLEELDSGSTRCAMTMEIDVVGPLAPLVELFAKGPQQALIRKTLANVRTKLETGGVPATAAAGLAAPSVAVPTAAAFGNQGRLLARIRAFFDRLLRRGTAGEA